MQADESAVTQFEPNSSASLAGAGHTTAFLTIGEHKARAKESAMTESDQRRILDLVAEGKLSVAAAEGLLTALSGSGAERTAEPAPIVAPRPAPPPAAETRPGA